MRLIKNGSVDVWTIEESTQSYPDIAKMYVMNVNCWNPVCTIGGDEAIQIFLRDGDKPDAEPTILSTGDSWSNFYQDDSIKVIAKCRQMEVVLVYFNLRNMKRVYIKPSLLKERERAIKRVAQTNHQSSSN